MLSIGLGINRPLSAMPILSLGAETITDVPTGAQFVANNATSSGQFGGVGQHYVVAGAGGTVTYQNRPTPALATNASGAMIHGVRANPVFDEASQPWHSGADSYDASLEATFPLTQSVGDKLVMFVGKTTASNTESYRRSGLGDGWVVVHVVAAAPAAPALTLGPGVFSSDTTLHQVDPAAWVTANAGSWAVPSGEGISYTDALSCLDRLFLYANRQFTKTSGYEVLNPTLAWRWSPPSVTAQNYGRHIAETLSMFGVMLDGDLWSNTEKAEIVLRLAQLGKQMDESLRQFGSFEGNGGHQQIHILPCLLYYGLTGQTAKLVDFMATIPGNAAQCIEITQAEWDLWDTTRTSGSALPMWSHERTVVAVDGNTVTLSSETGDNGQLDFGSFTLTGLTSGATGIIPHSHADPSSNFAVTLTDVSGAFQVSEKCRMTVTHGYRQFDWIERPSSLNYFSPSKDVEYRSLQRWFPQLLSAQRMGLIESSASQFDTIFAYVQRLRIPSDEYPVTGNAYPALTGDLLYNTSDRRDAPSKYVQDRLDLLPLRVLIIGQSQARIASVADQSVFTATPSSRLVTVIEGQTHNAGSTSVAQTKRTIGVDGYIGSDAVRSMAMTLDGVMTAADDDRDIEVMFDVIGGTSVLAFLDDSNDGRRFSDLQEKLVAHGNRFDVVINQWDTSHSTQITGGQEIDLLQGLATHGRTVDHTLPAALEPGYQYAIGISTRHAISDNDQVHSREEVARANELGYPVGLPVMDYYTDGTGPHPNDSEDGNVNLGVRWGILAARGAEITGATSNPYIEAAARSADGLSIDVTIAMPNGGQLYSPLPNALHGWAVTDSGASVGAVNAAIHDAAAGIIRLTKADGSTFPGVVAMGVNKTIRGGSNDPLNASVEQAIVDGELYETWAGDPTGKGLPVAGALNELGQWALTFPSFEGVTQTGIPASSTEVLSFNGSSGLSQAIAGFSGGSLDADGAWLAGYIYYDGVTWNSCALTSIGSSTTAFDFIHTGSDSAASRNNVQFNTTNLGTPSTEGWYFTLMHVALSGSNVATTRHWRNGQLNTIVNHTFAGDVSTFNMLSLGMIERSTTPFGFAQMPACGFAWGYGDPTALQAWVYNSGNLRDLSQYDFASDTDASIESYWKGYRDDSAAAFDVSEIVDEVGSSSSWNETGSMAWTDRALPWA